MERKTILRTILFICLIGVIIFVFWMHNSNKKEEAMKEQNAHKSAPGPALTRSQENTESNNKGTENNSKSNDKDDDEKKEHKSKEDNEKSSESEKKSNDSRTPNQKQSKEELQKNAEFLLTKTIEGTSSDKEQAKVEDLGTDKIINQVDGSEGNGEDLSVELRNVSLKLDKKANISKDDEVKATLKYDQISRPKDDDVKPSTEVNMKRSVLFKRIDGKLKVDKLQA